MTANASSMTGPGEPGGAGGPDGVGASDLGALLEHVRAADRHIAQAVALAGQLAGSGVCERVEGLPLEIVLGLAGRLTSPDRKTLLGAADTLAGMPRVAGLFAQGAVSWGQVRAIHAHARRLTRAQRAWLDERVAATVEERGGLEGFDPDELLWGVAQARDELDAPADRERADRRRAEDNFLSVQPDFDGGVRLYGAFDPVTGAGIVNALDAAAAPPAKDAPRPDPGPDGSLEDSQGLPF